MQNKGLVKLFALLLTLVCVFYLSFSFVTRHYANKAREVANGDPQVEQHYLDSLANEPVYFGNWTLKDCREMEISLGLDLKGGMNVILEVSVPDVIRALADNKPDEAFNQALANAAKQAITSQDDVITLFIREYQRLAPDGSLAEIFATQQLKDKVNQKSTDAEIERVLRSEVKAAIANSYNVLSTRIDRFGVVQPNIQNLEDKMGRIMVELPGIKEPERVRKLLQGSANLEFWETYDAKDITPYLQTANAKLRDMQAEQGNAEQVISDFTNKENVKILGTDIRFIKLGSTKLRPQGEFFFGSLGYCLWYVIPLLLFVAFVVIYRNQAKENANIAKLKTKKANKVATKRMKQAGKLLAENKKNEFYDEVLKALWGYIGDKLNIPVSLLSKDNVEAELVKYGVSGDLIKEFIAALNECEFARYAPGNESEAMDKVYAASVDIISKMENNIKH